MFSFFGKKCLHLDRKLVEGSQALICTKCGDVIAVPCQHRWHKPMTNYQICEICHLAQPVDLRHHVHVWKILHTNKIEGEISGWLIQCEVCGQMDEFKLGG